MSQLLVFTTCPDQTTAEALAGVLVEQHHAACVTLLPGATSFYHWQGTLTRDTELLLLIKTTLEAYPDLEQAITENHPYELPEVIAVPIETGLPGYLQWLVQQVDKNG